MIATRPEPLTSADAPLRPQDRWPTRQITLLQKDLADAERSHNAARIAAADAHLEAELEYLAELGMTLLHYATLRRPITTTSILMLPLDGVRHDLLGLAARVEELEAIVARLGAAVEGLAANRHPAREVS
ncbi:hypothetical protein [Limnoglobus roseus]|uniref:Uncharacterized protein n=1 Tax=Limnoglobus roseus TaxID=2598579 RepID=A0A5C1AJ06_9BACT|nr:hypothetical protein [Limnoglobus roseus]QEL18840.1 hypothetical protein PX52LOC_05881 [Limnoglobus roseus]